MSLLPVPRSRFADFALAFNLAAQGLTWRVLFACAWFGVADMITAGWVRWPVAGSWEVVWAAISVAAVTVGIVSLVRAIRQPEGRAGLRLNRALGHGRLL